MRLSLISVVLSLLSQQACDRTATVIPDPSQPDNSAPALQLGTAGLKSDISLNETSTAAEKRLAKR